MRRRDSYSGLDEWALCCMQETWEQMKTPERLTSMTAFQSSNFMRSTRVSRVMPALFTSLHGVAVVVKVEIQVKMVWGFRV